jgi:maltose alpha-D-glucosyltransferase/alpha-amylase
MAFGMTMPGVPFLYYGNEIGMRQLQDLPQIEGAYKPRAGARTPMQWNGGPSLGFSTAPAAKLYLPVDTAADAPNVEEQEKDPESLLNRVRKLIRLKHSEPALTAYASFVPLYAIENRYPFIYSRTSGGETVLVFLNPADNPAKAEFKFAETSEGMRLLAGKNISFREQKSKWRVEVPGRTFAVYKLDR